MADWRLETFVDLVQCAFRESGVFQREGSHDLLTAEALTVSGRRYVALLAGSANARHRALHANDSRRHELNTFPLRLRGNGEVDVCIVARPLEDSDEAAPDEHPAPFAPTEQLPWVAVREFHVRVFDLAENDLGVRCLRIEYDARSAAAPAQERWLRDWHRILGDNPAHSRWHVHVNSGDDAQGTLRGEFTDNDLRLAIGAPNPLTLVLSFAAWYQHVLRQQRP